MVLRYLIVCVFSFLSSAAFAADNVNVLSSHLQGLNTHYLAHQAKNPSAVYVESNSTVNLKGNDTVMITLALQSKTELEQIKRRLLQLGASYFAQYKKLLSARLPINQLSQLNNISGINHVSSHLAHLNSSGQGFAFNAADTSMFSDVVKKQYGVSGKGIKIGVLSDSYNCQQTADLDIETGDLPSNVQVLKEYPFCDVNGGSDEGRAMMQLIHDIAPDAELLFYTATESAVDFAAGIQALADAGANIIVDDVSYLTMPFFQPGPIAQSVNEVKARGVSYFSSAGNYARSSYQNSFVRRQVAISKDYAHDFGAAAGEVSNFYQKIILPPNVLNRITLQWDNPAETAGGTGATADLDFFLLDNTKRRILASSQDSNIAHDPVEFIAGSYEGETSEFYLYISHRGGPAPSNIKYIVFSRSEPWLIQATHLFVVNNKQTNDILLIDEQGDPMAEGQAVLIIDSEIVEIHTTSTPIQKDGNDYFIDYQGDKYVINTQSLPIWFVPEGLIAEVSEDDELLLFEPNEEESNSVSIEEFATHSSTTFGHANAEGGIAVGAIPYDETPWFGVSSDRARVEYFSSLGGTPLYFDKNGRRLPRQVFSKPEIIAPDGVDTTFFGTDSDNNGLPNFFGTSAAAPNAAAVAALLLERFSYLTPDALKLALTKGAVALNDPLINTLDIPEVSSSLCANEEDFNFATGCGLINAVNSFNAVSTISDDIRITIRSSQSAITAGVPFQFIIELVNHSNRAFNDVIVNTPEFSNSLSFLNIVGCDQIIGTNCHVSVLSSGQTHTITVDAVSSNALNGAIVMQANMQHSEFPISAQKTTRIHLPMQILTGDFNHDGCVDPTDWGVLYASLRMNLRLSEHDLDQDGSITMNDFTVLTSLYSNADGSSCK